jgi:predicted acyltransferase
MIAASEWMSDKCGTMTTETKLSEPIAGTPLGERLMSVDALRGFDMFWIIGADSFVYALNRMTNTPVVRFLGRQIEHAEWEGFHFYDLIFPLFVFIVGVSLVFSLSKSREAGRAATLIRIVRRSVLLFLLGIFYSGGLTNPWPDVRLMGVLNRIALVYFFAAILFTFFKPKVLAVISAALLAGYWALLTFVPIRDIQLTREALSHLAELGNDSGTAQLFKAPVNFSTVKESAAWSTAERFFYGTDKWVGGKFARGYNLSDHFDFRHLPGRKYDVFFDPEGLLSTIPAIASCLLGVFAGLLLQSRSIPELRKAAYLICFGILGAVLGWIWHFQIPVIKKIWTPSFVLVAGGYSSILMGFFYLLVDVWQARRWCKPFVWMGMNSITVYLSDSMVRGFRRLSPRIVGGDVSAFCNSHIAQGAGDLLTTAVGLLLAFWLVYFLYKRRIFLKI